MSNILKKAIGGLLDQILSSAKVLAVRPWLSFTVYEIDLHLPNINMEKWNTIKRLKCKVGDLEYRDYTPAHWNAEKRTCTIYIEAGHKGVGSRWVKQLKAGDEVLFGDAHAAQLPTQEGRILCIGDGSALGHFLALKQLTKDGQCPMDAIVYFHDADEPPYALAKSNPEYTFIINPNTDVFSTLAEWCTTNDLSIYTSVYIAGNIPMVTALRKKLKVKPEIKAKIYVHGFWS